MKHRNIVILLLITSIVTQVVGIILNCIVISMNRGMPTIGYEGESGMWVPINQETRFAFLSDVIRVGNYVGSLGDLFIIISMVTIMIATWIAMPQGRKLFPILVVSAFGIILSRAEAVYVATLLFLIAAVGTVLAMYFKYRSSVKTRTVVM